MMKICDTVQRQNFSFHGLLVCVHFSRSVSWVHAYLCAFLCVNVHIACTGHLTTFPWVIAVLVCVCVCVRAYILCVLCVCVCVGLVM